MQICKEHWAKIRQLAKDKGIDHLGAKSGEEALTDMKEQLAGRPTDYDPLMDINWMIQGMGLKVGGIYLMNLKEDGSHYCPICEAVLHAPKDLPYNIEVEWTEGPVNAAYDHCVENGLIHGKQ